MNSVLENMLKKYDTHTIEQKKNPLKEVVQEIVLSGLSRAGFFEKAAFYGGTALRIFYNLDRFSEDLDFSLIEPNKDFDLAKYFSVLEKEMLAYGIKIKIEEKKTKETNIKSAFLKCDTKEHLISFFSNDDFSGGLQSGELIKVKIEVDVNPPAKASYDYKYSLRPIPYQITLYDLSSLFAGKIHAILCRGWKNRVKGRDLYDYIFYLGQNANVNLDHLKERLAQSGAFNREEELSIERLKAMLKERFELIDFENAKSDVIDFVKDKESLNLWSKDFFIGLTNNLK